MSENHFLIEPSMYHFCGLTNQVWMFLVTLHYVLRTCRGVAVIYVGSFNTDIETGKRKISMQEIIDFEWLRQRLSVSVHFIDLVKPPPIRWVRFGKHPTTSVDLTEALRGKDIGKLISGKCPLTSLVPKCPDPCRNQKKRFVIKWADPSYPDTILQEHGWKLSGLIKKNHMLFPTDAEGWRTLNNHLREFRFHPSFYRLPFPTRLLTEHYAVVHLRNEMDAVRHWAPRNNVSIHQYQTNINQLYMRSIDKHIPPSWHILILTAEPVGNVVIQHLQQKGRTIITCPKAFPGERELCAAQDLVWSSLGQTEMLMAPMKGSTFSHWLRQIVRARVNISFDLDHITNDMVVETS